MDAGGGGGLAQDKQTEDAESFKKAFARLDGAKEAPAGQNAAESFTQVLAGER